MTLIQRRTPQAIMGRVSTSVEVVMAAPQAVSLAIGSLLVVLISYRLIFLVMAVVTAAAAVYVVVTLRGQIAADRRRPRDAEEPGDQPGDEPAQEPGDAVRPGALDLTPPLTPTEL